MSEIMKEAMSDRMEELLDHMRENYVNWSRSGPDGSTDIKTEMEEEYADGLVY